MTTRARAVTERVPRPLTAQCTRFYKDDKGETRTISCQHPDKALYNKVARAQNRKSKNLKFRHDGHDLEALSVYIKTSKQTGATLVFKRDGAKFQVATNVSNMNKVVFDFRAVYKLIGYRGQFEKKRKQYTPFLYTWAQWVSREGNFTPQQQAALRPLHSADTVFITQDGFCDFIGSAGHNLPGSKIVQRDMMRVLFNTLSDLWSAGASTAYLQIANNPDHYQALLGRRESARINEDFEAKALHHLRRMGQGHLLPTGHARVIQFLFSVDSKSELFAACGIVSSDGQPLRHVTVPQAIQNSAQRVYNTVKESLTNAMVKDEAVLDAMTQPKQLFDWLEARLAKYDGLVEDSCMRELPTLVSKGMIKTVPRIKEDRLLDMELAPMGFLTSKPVQVAQLEWSQHGSTSD